MKKMVIGLLSFASTFSFCSCSSGNINSSDLEEKVIEMSIIPDYGNHIKDKVTLLLDGSIIPFKNETYNISKLIAFDVVEITYTGTYIVNETYPSTIDTKKMHIKNVELLYRGGIYEFSITTNEYGEKVLFNEDSKSYARNELFEQKCINGDNSFQLINTYDVGTKIYGINPPYYSSINISAFYSFNPTF